MDDNLNILETPAAIAALGPDVIGSIKDKNFKI